MIFIQTRATNLPPSLLLLYFLRSTDRYLEINYANTLLHTLPLSLLPQSFLSLTMVANYLSCGKRPFVWKRNVYTHGRRLLSAILKNVWVCCSSCGFYFILLAAFSSLLFYFFPHVLIQRGEKNKRCKCPCAWLNTCSFFLPYIPLPLETYLTCVLQSTYSTSWSGAGRVGFSPWKPLNGLGGIGSFSHHSSKVFQEFSGVLWSVKRTLQEGNVSTWRRRADGNWQQHSKCSKKGNCMSWDETSCHDQHWFKRSSSFSPTRVSGERVWDLKNTNTRTQNDFESNTNGCNGCLFLRVADISSSV